MKSTGTIAVAMSGGVDSSVTAWRLKEQGFDVVGVSFDVFGPGTIQGAGKAGDVRKRDVEAVCSHLGIDVHFLSFGALFESRVVKPFVEAYSSGATPNPCILCNQTVKFGALMDFALEKGFAGVATGHHARIDFKDGRYRLLPGHDKGKDQSYFLYPLTQETMALAQFPIGDLTKDEVRVLAAKAGLPVAEKRDSQEICFVPNDDYVGFLEGCGGVSTLPGKIVMADGTVLGEHNGLHRYTIGQRKGLGVAWRHPLYVVDKRQEVGELVVGDHEDLACQVVEAVRPVWTRGSAARQGEMLEARIRYRSPARPAVVEEVEEGWVKVRFVEPVFGVATGQSLVLSDGEEVVGGAWITAAHR